MKTLITIITIISLCVNVFLVRELRKSASIDIKSVFTENADLFGLKPDELQHTLAEARLIADSAGGFIQFRRNKETNELYLFVNNKCTLVDSETLVNEYGNIIEGYFITLNILGNKIQEGKGSYVEIKCK